VDESRMEYRKRMELELLKRVATDAAFRAQLLADPKKTVELVLGSPLPPNISVTVIEEKPSELCLVIPGDVPAELSDADLEAVSGGGIIKSTRYDGSGPRSVAGVRG